MPEYSSKYSRKDYTQHQLATLLCLMRKYKPKYRDFVELLNEMTTLIEFLGLKKVPHFTTLNKFFIRSIPLHQSIILKSIIVAEKRGKRKTTGEIYDIYNQICKHQGLRPTTKNWVGRTIAEFEMLGIVNRKIISRGKYGRTSRVSLAIPLDETEKVLSSDYVYPLSALGKKEWNRLMKFVDDVRGWRMTDEVEAYLDEIESLLAKYRITHEDFPIKHAYVIQKSERIEEIAKIRKISKKKLLEEIISTSKK